MKLLDRIASSATINTYDIEMDGHEYHVVDYVDERGKSSEMVITDKDGDHIFDSDIEDRISLFIDQLEVE